MQCLRISAHVFIDRPQNCTQILFRLRAGLCPNFGSSRVKVRLGRSRSKLCTNFHRLHTKPCPNFGRSRTRLCPNNFAPCPSLNLAGALSLYITRRLTLIDTNNSQRLLVRRTFRGARLSTNLQPELLVERAGDEAALEEDHDALVAAAGDLKVEVLTPVPQLRALERLHVEIRTADL